MGARAVSVAAFAATAALVWIAVLFHASIVPSLQFPVWVDEITVVFPLWLLVSFGSYSLGCVGYSLMTFNDCPDAHRSLVKEIQVAKDDLRRKGVTVD